MQYLAHVDVAQTGYHFLIRECCLDRGLLAPAGTCQHVPLELVRERLGPECAQQRLLAQLSARDQLHHSEPPGVVERNKCPGGHVKLYMIVRRMPRGRAIIGSRRMDPARLCDAK